MPVLKDHYYRLASEVPQERIEAATALLQELIQVNEKDEWDYALSRLIKGLTSSRQSARLGFSMALIEVLRELVEKEEHELTVSSFLLQVLKLSQVKSSMKGKEERSVLFGRLFGLQVLLNSQLLFNEKVTSSDLLCEFVDKLVELSSLKSWLRETSIFTLCQFISTLKGNSNEDLVLVYILQKVNDSGLNLTTEGIALYLSIPQEKRGEFASKLDNQKSNWKNGDPLSKGNLPTLAKALKDVEVVELEANDNDQPKSKNGNSKQKGSWNPRLHFVWDILIQNFNKYSVEDSESIDSDLANSKKRKKSSNKSSKKQKLSTENEVTLKEFWKVVVDETLFADKSSHERKYWGFEIFIKFLKATKSSEISSLFTANFMRCFINQSSQKNRMLNKISLQVMDALIESCTKDFTKAPVILNCLIDESNGGCWNFDLVTKSKCTDKLIGILSTQDIQNEFEVGSVLNKFKDVLISKFNYSLENEEDRNENDIDDMKKPNDNVQKWALDKLLLLFRSNKLLLSHEDLSTKWLERILKLLIQHAFFRKADKPYVSGNIKKICQDRLNSILSDIINIPMKDHSWPLSTCITYIKKLESSGEYENLLDFDDTLITVKEDTLSVLEEIEQSLGKVKKDNQRKDQLNCFKLLFSMILIQFYMGDEETVTVLDELKVSYQNIFSKTKAEDMDSSVFLTEIILSFTSRKATLLKKLSSIAWESFLCSKDETGKVKLNEECLQLLYDVLEARENKEGQQKLFEAEDEFEEVNDEVDGSENSNESEEEGDDNESDDESEDNDSEDADDESDSDQEDESNNANKSNEALSEVDKQTNLKLAQALGIPTESSGEVKFEDLSSLDDDADSSYESDPMDDEQMMAMDDQLSKIFKERHDAMANVATGNKRKAEVIEAKEQMVFFKNRILDLLELFNKHQPSSYLNLTMIKPLVVLINLTMDKNLGLKAHKLLKSKLSRTKITKEEMELNFPSKSDQAKYKDSLMSLIEWLHNEANSAKSSNHSHSLACNQSCIIVAKSLISLDELFLNKIIDLYAQSLKTWASEPNSKIQASMFFDFINWLNSKRGN